MAACNSQGAYAQMAFDDTAVDTNSQPMHFLRETLAAKLNLADDGDRAIRGERSHIEDRVNEGLIEVRGSTWHEPTPEEIDYLLPFILGGAESTDVFDVADDLTELFVAVDKVAKVFTFNNGKISKAIFSGSKGRPVQLKLEWVFKTVTEANAGTFPSLTFSTQQPFVFHEGVLTLDSSTRQFDRFAVIIDNRVEAEFNNSQTATCVQETDRHVFLATSTPYTSSETDIYSTNDEDVTGAAGSLVFTKGGQSMSMAFGNLKLMAQTPVVEGKKEIRLPLQYKAYKTGSTSEIVITNDPVA